MELFINVKIISLINMTNSQIHKLAARSLIREIIESKYKISMTHTGDNDSLSSSRRSTASSVPGNSPGGHNLHHETSMRPVLDITSVQVIFISNHLFETACYSRSLVVLVFVNSGLR